MPAIALALAGCSPPAPAAAFGPIATRDRPFFSTLPLGVKPTLPVPAANPITREKVELGGRLFFDQRLSRDGSVACATCHVPEHAFSDGRPFAIGIGGAVGRRNAPTLLNRAYGGSFFWDGRAPTLEEQALLPMMSPLELGNTHEEIVRRLGVNRDYRRRFARAFNDRRITIERVATAIASFERTLVSGDSPLDRFLLLGDSAALTPAARRGLELFHGKAHCVVCHDGVFFTDEHFHNTGIAWRNGAFADSGRFSVTGRSDDLGAFKTPTLRDVALTAPYMHDGSVATLEDVLEFYDDGGRRNPHLDAALRPLGLRADERAALVAFLRSLTGRRS
ncbi:MAG: c-type cytochrome [Gemmatimonadetes bacterium]|nr:c-type cytochrome [Gemmatimonadota bacterium]